MSDQDQVQAQLEAPEKLAQPGESVKDNTRPELHFQNRRRLAALFFIGIILLVCVFFAERFSNPLKGADMMLTGGASAANRKATEQAAAAKTNSPGFNPSVAGLAVTATPPAIGGSVMSAVQPATSNAPAAVARSAAPAAVPEISSIFCRATGNFSVGDIHVPLGTLVRAAGFSYAGNGKVLLTDPSIGWVDVAWISCPPEIVRLERPYFISPTGTPTGKAKGAAEVIRVPVPQTVVVSATPCVLPQAPATVNGVVLDGDCVIFQITGVRAIYADGKPVSGGSRLCGVNNFSITIR